MKTFAYTYRDKEGALKKSALQAADRLDALRQIRAMGCVPVSVTEGKAGVSGAGVHWNSAWNRQAVWVTGAAVILIAVLAVWLTVYKKPVAKSPALKTTAAWTPPRGVRSGLGETALPKHPDSVSPTVQRPPKAVMQTAKVSPPGPAPVPTAPVVVPAPPAVEPKEPEPIHFATMSEQMLALISSVPPGVSVPPLPDLSYWDMKGDLEKTATNILFITEQDDDNLTELKEKVAWSKLDVVALAKDGYTGSDILNALQQDHNEKAEWRFQISTKLKAEVNRSEDVNTILKTLSEINKALKEQNLPEIKPGEIGITTDEEE